MKSMLLGIALAATTAVAPVWAADKSADFNALRSGSDALSQRAVQERTGPVPLSTQQLDSVKAGHGTHSLITVCKNGSCHFKIHHIL